MKNHKLLWFIIVVLAGAFVWAFFFHNNISYTATPAQTQTNTQQTSPTTETTSVGSSAPILQAITNNSGTVQQEQFTVSGQYNYSEDPKSLTGGRVCFSVDSATADNIVKFSGNTKTPFFCFENQDEVLPLFNIQRGFSDGSSSCTVEAPATIEVKDYQLLTGGVTGFDSATLTKVVSQGAQIFSPCK